MSDAGSITSWLRLEPIARDRSMRSALGARWADPAWALARQWQTAEFHADDGGTPGKANLTLETARISRYYAGRRELPVATGVPYDAATVPLEVVVEGEPANGATDDLLASSEAGTAFLAILGRSKLKGDYRASFVDAYPIDPDWRKLLSKIRRSRRRD
jgi:hypothetical protein